MSELTSKALEAAISDCEKEASSPDKLAVIVGKMSLRHVCEELRHIQCKHAEYFALFVQIHEQLMCPARNTTVTSNRRDGSVIISEDIRRCVSKIVCPEPTVPCKLCGSPVSLFNDTKTCSDCELRIHQESQVP